MEDGRFSGPAHKRAACHAASRGQVLAPARPTSLPPALCLLPSPTGRELVFAGGPFGVGRAPIGAVRPFFSREQGGKGVAYGADVTRRSGGARYAGTQSLVIGRRRVGLQL